ncbi:MAG: hypothetical protein EOP49_40610 [Sphingobacteriales bacterium]|nr:MAG: hypothetical protein EOP49_40610 [Sphingobacteriales bacterium]
MHIIGIVLVVGGAFLFDLRLLGSSGHLHIIALSRHLLPWSLRGLFLVVPSGLLLFATNAVTLAYDPVFWLKITLLFLAGCNAFVFHKIVSRSMAGVKTGTPLLARLLAVISVLLWIAIIACGRLLAY